MKFIVTRTTPNGEVREYEASNARDAGKHVADVLHLNTGMGKKEATTYGMMAERSSSVEAGGYVFMIVPVVPWKSRCRALTKSNHQCHNIAINGTLFCRVHAEH
jgi:hypothetical protein